MIFKKKKEKQGLNIYCPKCNLELIGSGRYIKTRNGVTEYKCNRCGTTSFWYDSYPAPHLRTCGECMHLKIGKFGEAFCNYEENGECNPETQKMFDVHGCEYCDGYKQLITNDDKDRKVFIKYPNRLISCEYENNRVKYELLRIIKYCPMCGKKLKEDDKR